MKETNQMPVGSKRLSLPNDIHAYHTYQHLNWTCTPSPTLTPPGNHQIFIQFSYRLFQLLVLRISLMWLCLMLCLTKLWHWLSVQTDFGFWLGKECIFPLWQHSPCEIQGIFHTGLHLFQQKESSWKHGKLSRNEV